MEITLLHNEVQLICWRMTPIFRDTSYGTCPSLSAIITEYTLSDWLTEWLFPISTSGLFHPNLTST